MTAALFADDIFDLAAIAYRVAERDPERVAVIAPAGRNVDGSRRYRHHTYRKLSHDVESVALGMRELSRHLRELTPGGQTHHSGFAKQDRSRFLGELENCIQALKRAGGPPGAALAR